MPEEYGLLKNKPFIFNNCPKCGNEFRQMMRGKVFRHRRWFIFGPKRHYCAVICLCCKSLVGWESP